MWTAWTYICMSFAILILPLFNLIKLLCKEPINLRKWLYRNKRKLCRCTLEQIYMMAQLLSSWPRIERIPLRATRLLSSLDTLQASSFPSLLIKTVLFWEPIAQPPFFITNVAGGECSYSKYDTFKYFVLQPEDIWDNYEQL